jgi:hypothetical protein
MWTPAGQVVVQATPKGQSVLLKRTSLDIIDAGCLTLQCYRHSPPVVPNISSSPSTRHPPQTPAMHALNIHP